MKDLNIINSTKPFEGLELHLEKNLKMQSENVESVIWTTLNLQGDDIATGTDLYGNYAVVDIAMDSYFDLNKIIGGHVRISNCEFDVFDGTMLFGAVGVKGILGMKLTFWSFEELYKKFKSLPVFSLFREVHHNTEDGDTLYQYYFTCGSDIKTIAMMYTYIMKKVYGLRDSDVTVNDFWTSPYEKNLNGVWTDKKADHRNYLKSHGLREFKLPATNGMMTLRKNLDDTFFELLDKYANKYGRYLTLQYMLTDDNRHLIEVFGYQKTPRFGFFSKYIMAYREMKSKGLRDKISRYCEFNWKNY